MNKFVCISIFILACYSCKNSGPAFDATGTFEADEIIVSSEGSGKLISFPVEEGQELEANQTVGIIDSTQLYLKKEQVQAQIRAVMSKEPNSAIQLAAIQDQIKTANREKQRVTNLLAAGAATQKQLDDISAQISVLEKQLEAQQSTLSVTTHGINSETLPLTVQIAQLDDQLNKCSIVNPVKGTVLTKYAEQSEVTTMGKALYKIADMRVMTLRAYVSGDQLPMIKTGDMVKVNVDAGDNQYKTFDGKISWISDKAEFTPKTIQTKDERANLVYAIKILVTNDGSIKIGMYGEVDFPSTSTEAGK